MGVRVKMGVLGVVAAGLCYGSEGAAAPASGESNGGLQVLR
jgi:hypothetical protein